MIGKFFDPFSKLARDAENTNTSVYIGQCSENIDNIKNKIEKSKDDIER